MLSPREQSRQWRASNPEKVKRLNALNAARGRRWNEAHPGEARKRAAAERAANPERARAHARKSAWKKQGIKFTESDYDTMFAKQGGCCAVCREKKSYRLCADHDHSRADGRVRGLLCRKCNQGLGYFDDNPVRLVDAARYLTGGDDA